MRAIICAASFSQSVENDAKWNISRLICGTRKADCSFSRRKRFVTRTKGKTGGFFLKKHGSQIAMAHTDLTVISDRARDTKRLEPFTQSLCNIRCTSLPLFNCGCGANQICPARISNDIG